MALRPPEQAEKPKGVMTGESPQPGFLRDKGHPTLVPALPGNPVSPVSPEHLPSPRTVLGGEDMAGRRQEPWTE